MHEVERQVGQAVEQVRILRGRTGGFGGVGRVQLCESGLTLGLQSVVALAQALGEGVSGIAGLGLAQDVLLAMRESVESALKPVSLGLPLSRCPVIDGREFRREQLSALGAEHPVREEGRDRFENGVLAQIDGLGVAGVGVGAAAVVGLRLTAVVSDAVAVFTEHPPVAGVQQHPS
ncbi:hypothetical protein [Streptomyces pseudoechinosporeus]